MNEWTQLTPNSDEHTSNIGTHCIDRLVWVQTRLSKAIKNLDISDEKSALLMNTIDELYKEVKRKYGEGNEERFQRMERAIEDIRRNWGDVEGNTEMLKARANDLHRRIQGHPGWTVNPHKPFLFSNYFINVDGHPSGMSMRFATSSGLQIELRECGEDAWKIFKPHFHLPEVHRTACRRYIGMLGDQPVSFIAVVPYANDKHAKDGRKILHLSRVTVLPNFRSQGIGEE